MLFNVIKDHDPGDLDCATCEEQFGHCSCGGVVHCEYQETFRLEKVKGKDGKVRKEYVPTFALTLECDTCDDYEIS